MATDYSQFIPLLAQAMLDLQKLNDIVHGDASATVETDAGTVDSLAKAIAAITALAGPVHDDFTGDGVETDWTLSTTPKSADALMVFVNGVPTRAFTLDGATLTIDPAVTDTHKIETIDFSSTAAIDAADLKAVADTIADISAVAADLAGDDTIGQALTKAAEAAASASAAATSETNAATSETNAAASASAAATSETNAEVSAITALTAKIDAQAAQTAAEAAQAAAEAAVGWDTSVTLEAYAAAGDGVTDDSAAWNSAVADAHTNGKTLILDGRSYYIPNATTQDLTTEVTVVGIGNSKLLGGSGGPVLFRPLSAGLRFWNIYTENMALIDNFNELTGNIDLIDIRGWRYSNGAQFSARLREDYSSGYYLTTLRLLDISGTGGLGGLSFSLAVKYADVDDYDVRDISVPNSDDHFDGDDMINSGYGDGLLIGDDDPDAQDLCVRWSIGRVAVAGINDARVQKNSGQVASCDGVRLLGQNMLIGQLLIEGVTSYYRSDTTAVYFKGQNSSVGQILTINAGHHEASVVFKGARRVAGSQAKGFNIDVDKIKLFADDGEDRAAVYFGTDDIRVGYLSVEGYGGDIEDPDDPGVRLQGSGALVYCEASESERLQIDGYSFYNCSVGGTAAAVRLFTLQGYKEIRIGVGYIDGVSNDNLFSTQTPSDDPTPYPILHVFHWVETTVAARLISIGPVNARNFSGNGSDVRLITMGGSVDLDRLVVHSPICDATVNDGITLSSGADPVSAIDHFELIGGDLSACPDNQLVEGITPGTRRIFGCKGVYVDPTVVADIAGGSQTINHSGVERLEYLNGDVGGWSDTDHDFTAAEAGVYLIDIYTSVRPDTAEDVLWTLEAVKSNGAEPTPTENVIARMKTLVAQRASTADHESLHVSRVFELAVGEKLFGQLSHDSGTNKVLPGGTAAENFIQITKLS
ncbi:hypothetical protein [Minwuia thermotolerans]|uniref:Pectate lyase superfamily protein domain-containing protein n=1 Tax=Minwuia thermotolerans TaxID=2056226 RepID=A0A2M9G432_9PROT|nr:hypothetical protein [Minwuia thermotolerans]PJK29342.1 hypothetical protein CVT23_12120 [Minwuia thermotolerans]PJK30473.1 hypothetical protein CVT23_05875 [Minwuia thermotolerans]PJK30696.1 hypothetical protein CVT23_04825 [Minwuia thermotolerans]